MRKMIFAPHGLFSPEREVLHTIAIDFLKKDDFVEIVYCKQGNCSINPLGINALCTTCNNKNEQFSNILKKNVKNSDSLKISWYENTEIENISLNRDVKKTEYKGHDLGYAILSTYIGITRDFEPDLKKRYQKKILSCLASTFQNTYEYFISRFEKQIYDEFHLFNGRLNNSRAALRAAQKSGIKTYTHELVGLEDKIQTFSNCLPHDLKANQNKINSLYKKNFSDSKLIAEEFYSLKRIGHAVGDKSYVSKQKKQLPEGWSTDKRNITFFTSSEDEFKAIGKEWEGGIFSDQIDAIKNVLNCLDESTDFLYVRIHPNVQNAAKKYLKSIMSIKHDCLKIIPPSSKVSSYLLMENSDIVITCGSTIGIEAAYWGKPSILLSPSFYMGLGSTYEPANFKELKEIISRKKIEPLPNVGAIKLGVFYHKNGTKLNGFEGKKSKGYTFFGNEILNKSKDKYLYNISKFFEKVYIELLIK